MENSQPHITSSPGSRWLIALSVILLIGLFYYVAIGLFNYFASGGWPPASIVRRDQRKVAMERVQAAGGWPALQRACEDLVESNRETGFDWVHGFWLPSEATNGLPPAIAALQPLEVSFVPPKAVPGSSDESNFSVVHIKIFGIHRTGRTAIPYFGLDFVYPTNANSYIPRPGGGVSGNSHDSYLKVADRIYEIYGPD
jgi:hypothetical protein